jgi:hypothetical protein
MELPPYLQDIEPTLGVPAGEQRLRAPTVGEPLTVDGRNGRCEADGVGPDGREVFGEPYPLDRVVARLQDEVAGSPRAALAAGERHGRTGGREAREHFERRC